MVASATLPLPLVLTDFETGIVTALECPWHYSTLDLIHGASTSLPLNEHPHASEAPLPCCPALFFSSGTAIRLLALKSSIHELWAQASGLTFADHDRESAPAVGAHVAEFRLGLHPWLMLLSYSHDTHATFLIICVPGASDFRLHITPHPPGTALLV